jgi:cytochrome c oxidase subunit 2
MFNGLRDGARAIGRAAARFSAAFALAAALAGGAALIGEATAGTGQPSPRQIGMQGPATEVAAEITRFHDVVNIIIIAIAVFVGVLMLYVLVRFNARANPTPTRTTHNTFLEVAWTVIPIVILVLIAIPSFKLLYLQYTFPKPDLTIKAIGNAWFWEHEYPDHGGLKVTSNMVRDEDVLKQALGNDEFKKRYANLEDGLARMRILQADAAPHWEKLGMVRQLSVDNEIAVPVNKVVHLLVTATDVIHSWTIPSFGSKTQAVPGRVTQTWFRPTRTGIYYGQCSVLCGKEHASMPIAVRVVSEAAFKDWTEAVRAKDWRRARTILRAATETGDSRQYADAAAAAASE